ncbi:Sulfotransferase family protein [Planctomycetales bacterium 10988]|nr:Sulfotransferase family protein [Planctomycetales bacterium 10988]
MDVQHSQTAPVLLLGHGSSGTSILSRLFRQYLKISFGTESQFIIRFLKRLPMYGDLNQDENLSRLVEHLCQERWFSRCEEKFGFRTTPNEILSRIEDRTYRGVLNAIFESLAEHQGMDRWGDKTPEYVFDLPLLKELWPEAKYIHLIRDGRDVALSVMGRYWGPKNIYTAAREWNEAVCLIDAFVETLPSEQICEVRYEDLLSQPKQTFARLIEFLGISNSTDDLLAQLEPHLLQDLNQGNWDKWKRAWTEKEQLAFEQIGWKALQRHGYEVILEKEIAEPSLVTRAWSHVDNRLRKWTYADYWQDNLYKLQLRSREAVRFLR